jgi:hypothetical protein
MNASTVKPPKYLYRYQRFPHKDETVKLKRLEMMFVENKCFASCPLWFNDPFDCKTRFSAQGMNPYQHEQFVKFSVNCRYPDMSSSQKKLQLHREAKLIEQLGIDFVLDILETTLKDGLKETGVLSFSESHDNILMWSHYSDGHRGFCLQLDTTTFPQSDIFVQMDYRDEYPTLKEFLHLQRHGTTADRNKIFLSRKSRLWEYEKEWRLLIHAKEGLNEILNTTIKGFPEDAMAGVILGCEMEPDNKKQIQEWIGKRKAPVRIYEAKKSQNEYAVDVEGIS